jgi:glycosyltransferase involved in cell wall biosynthesis
MEQGHEPYSVLMSTYWKESPEFLKAAVESMLAQTVKPSEFVLVCDGKLTEQLNQVIDSFGEKLTVYRRDENRGLGQSLQEGLQHCHEDIIVRMDSDDISLPNRCARELQAMRKYQADIVSGTVLEFSEEKTIAKENMPSSIDSDALTERVISNADVLRTMPDVIGRRALPEKHEDILRYSRKRNPFNHPAVCFRKDVILRAGGYNDAFPLFEDYDLWTRALANGAKGYNLTEPVLYMRAPKDLYKRRGGWRYAKDMLRFHESLLKRGYTTLAGFLTGAVPHAIVCVLPAALRQQIYKTLHT